MKINIISLLLFLFFLINHDCMSQKNNYVAGFYVNQKGDSVNGYFSINKNDALSNFKFKSRLQESSHLNISFDTCKTLSFGKNYYINWFGKRGMAFISKFEFTIINIDSFRTEKIPLKLIFKGNHLSLYYYRDVTDHFFMSLDNSIEELSISYKYLTDWEKLHYTVNLPTYLITPLYRYQIIARMSDKLTTKQKYLVESCEYDVMDLTRLFRKLDNSLSK